MIDLFCLHTKFPKQIFIASFISFLILNLIENVIHYNIGRNRDVSNGFIVMSAPDEKDWYKIIVIMIIFAFLQGGLTILLNNIMSK